MTVHHEDPGFDALAKDLTARTGVSLASYKPKCLRRRIAVRMRACGVHTYDEYRGVLASTPDEVGRLHDALTINVTRFFRNPETWEAVKNAVLPGLLAKNGPVRAWSAGCSSGEEAHTMAMLWAEAVERAGHPEWLDRLQIDATDIDRECMLRARAGTYRADAFVESPPRLVERWTRPEGESRVVDARLRARIQVSPFDLTQDPVPPRRYDLVACRNVVIYFDRPTQERLFAGFHDALVPGGILVLGKVETLVGPARDLLELVDVRERIYRRPA
jgi:chemotaxis methyl-accepting protein methylase